MTDRKTLAARALIEKQILKDLNEAHYRTRAELAELFVDPGDREVGKLLDHRLGTVSLEAGRETWTVTDEDQFSAWVEENWSSDEIETVKRVRPALRAYILARVQRDGAFLDEVTGEALDVPGLEKRTSSPTLVERTDKHAGLAIRAWLGVDTAKQLGIER